MQFVQFWNFGGYCTRTCPPVMDKFGM